MKKQKIEEQITEEHADLLLEIKGVWSVALQKDLNNEYYYSVGCEDLTNIPKSVYSSVINKDILVKTQFCDGIYPW